MMERETEAHRERDVRLKGTRTHMHTHAHTQRMLKLVELSPSAVASSVRLSVLLYSL